MNEEHTASLPAERQRVEAAGATISQTADGKLRVGGIIQVTRCIGDNPLRHLGLTSEPELRHVPIGCARRRPPAHPVHVHRPFALVYTPAAPSRKRASDSTVGVVCLRPGRRIRHSCSRPTVCGT